MEWMLDHTIFNKLCTWLDYVPDVDLFATRINTQLDTFVSWKPDPDACHVNAFTMSWWRGLNYAFPPFSIIGSMLQKMLEDEATILVILPLWPTQVWFPKALQFLVEGPVVLPRQCITLPQDPSRKHPRASTVRFTAMLLSGYLSKVKVFVRSCRIFTSIMARCDETPV